MAGCGILSNVFFVTIGKILFSFSPINMMNFLIPIKYVCVHMHYVNWQVDSKMHMEMQRAKNSQENIHDQKHK